MFKHTFSLLFLAVVTRGVPAPEATSNLPSMLTISSEDELGLYSKKWNLTPVQMCTLMGHQMTIAQPLLDINHPLVAHLPSIGEMAMSDAVMICEKVLNDAKGRTATVTTVVEETRQEYSVPRNFLFDDEFELLTEDLMDNMGFSDDEMHGAILDNEKALKVFVDEKKEAKTQHHPQRKAPKVQKPPTPPEPTIAEKMGKVQSA